MSKTRPQAWKFAGLLVALLAVPFVARAGELPERCRLEPQNGPCKALLEKYYFDPGRNRCVSYIYDGCGPVVPFDELEECQALCETDEVPHLDALERIEGLPYLDVRISYPKTWDSPTIRAYADDREIPTMRVGGGFDQTTNFESVRLAPGPEGCRRLAVTLQNGEETHHLGTRFYFRPPADLIPLAHFGDDEVVTVTRPLQFALHRLSAPQFRLNGKPLAAEPLAQNTHGLDVVQLSPDWVAGSNTLIVEAMTDAGGRFEKSWTFFDLTGETLPLGHEVRLAYGYPGSKSGPFYELEVVGDAVAVTDHAERMAFRLTDGWLMHDPLLVADIVARQPGESRLRILLTSHFLSHSKLDREYLVRVPPTASQ